jgi:hypothetical protein
VLQAVDRHVISGISHVLRVGEAVVEALVGYSSRRTRGTVPVLPNNPARKKHNPVDRSPWRKRNPIERPFCRP